MKLLAVIPCREESTRVPGKNLMVMGPMGDKQPNLVRTIREVRKCEAVTTVAVVSDDSQARELACRYGCLALKEPPHVARHGDLYDVMDFATRSIKAEWSAIVLAYPNVPIRPPDFFCLLLEEYQRIHPDSITAVCPDRNCGGGTIFRWDYLQQMIEDRTAADRHDLRFIHFRQDEIVEIDSPEDVTWANTLFKALPKFDGTHRGYSTSVADR